MVRKALVMAMTTVLFAAPAAMAQQLSDEMDGEGNYTVPVQNPDLIPYATFSIHNYKVRMLDDGRHVMTYDLPLDLTGGRKVEIRMVETNPGAAVGQPIILEGPKGRTECRARDEDSDWDDLDCSIKFRNLGVNQTQAANYVQQKYRGTERADKVRDVVIGFLYEPIGDVGTQGVDADCRCSIGNGEWRVRYQNPQAQWVDARMTLDRLKGTYYTSGGSGVLSNLRYRGDELTGRWTYGGSGGWFRFSIDGHLFRGEWGQGTVVGQQRRGQWNGQRE